MTCVAWLCIASGTCWLLGLDLRQRIAIATHREVVEYIIFDIMKPDDRAIVLSKLLHLSMLVTLLSWLQVAPLHRCKYVSGKPLTVFDGVTRRRAAIQTCLHVNVPFTAHATLPAVAPPDRYTASGWSHGSPRCTN